MSSSSVGNEGLCRRADWLAATRFSEGTSSLDCGASVCCKLVYVPIESLDDSMRLWSALFTVIILGCEFLVSQAHTASMLPNVAVIALYKEISYIFRDYACYIWSVGYSVLIWVDSVFCILWVDSYCALFGWTPYLLEVSDR